MSARQTFAYCFDCHEIGYGIADKNGVYQRDSSASNHWNHRTHVFGPPDAYTPPIKQVLTKLHARLDPTDAEIILFKLAIALGDLDDKNKQNRKKGRPEK